MSENIDQAIQSTLIDDARTIIETARANAVRSVDFCRVLLSKLLPRIWKPNSEADSEYGDWNVQDNFSAFIQLRPRCGRNSLEQYSLLPLRAKV